MEKQDSTDKPLYDDGQIRIDFHPGSIEEHFLYIDQKMGQRMIYTLQRGVLDELARTPRGGLWAKIDAVNPTLPIHVKKEEIGIDGLHVALCQAYIEQERRVSEHR